MDFLPCRYCNDVHGQTCPKLVEDVETLKDKVSNLEYKIKQMLGEES